MTTDTTTRPTITTDVVSGVPLPRETRGQGKPVVGTEVRIFADGRLVGTVEVPDAHPSMLELIAVGVTVGTDWRDRTVRARFPSGGSRDYTADEVAAVEATVAPA
jgi:hypothetical protein